MVDFSLSWSFSVEGAPRGKLVKKRGRDGKDITGFEHDKVILATKCGIVAVSRWLPGENRWEGLAKGEQPIAWMPYPTHPNVIISEASDAA